jgi:hypothetical protein
MVAGGDWYLYQGDVPGEASSGNRYCGQACVAMAIQYIRGMQYEDGTKISPLPTVVATTGKSSEERILLKDLDEALRAFRIEAEPIAEMEAIRAAVQDRGHIVIALLDMSRVETRGADYEMGHSDPASSCHKYRAYDEDHWVVVRGITDDGRWIIVHDPYVFERDVYWHAGDPGPPKGRNRAYLALEFAAAFEAAGADALEVVGGMDPAIAMEVLEQPQFPLVEPRQEIEIRFVLQNTGSEAWRAGHYALVSTNGVRVAIRSQTAPAIDVPSGATVPWQFTIVAPMAPGRYPAEWRFSYDGDVAGPVLWTEVIVVPDVERGLNPGDTLRALYERARRAPTERLEEARRALARTVWAEAMRRVEDIAAQVCGGGAIAVVVVPLVFGGLWGSARSRRER